MIKRVIENWLINTNETNYRIPFCQVLINRGHKVKMTHGKLENGKDIISIDRQGKYYAFQLKTGNISEPIYDKIQTQINDLIILPIDHPNFDKNVPHFPFLVTNGEINEFARQKIQKYNEVYEKKGFNPLNLCEKEFLLKSFIDAQGKFIPTELKILTTF